MRSRLTGVVLWVTACLAVGVPGCGKRPELRPSAEVAGAVEEQAPAGPGGFRYPEDGSGELLAQLLPLPDQLPEGSASEPAPVRLANGQALELPALPLPPPDAALPAEGPEPPRLPLPTRPVPEDVPLFRDRAEPVPPQRVTMPAHDGTRVPSARDEPPPLPILAAPRTQRPTGDDMIRAFGERAALSAPIRTPTNPGALSDSASGSARRAALRQGIVPSERQVPVITPALPER
jgi:hypothetical protein